MDSLMSVVTSRTLRRYQRSLPQMAKPRQAAMRHVGETRHTSWSHHRARQTRSLSLEATTCVHMRDDYLRL